MIVTKNPEASEDFLTQAQLAALPLLAAGAMKKDAAAAAGVVPQTVSAWLQAPHFSTALKTELVRLAGGGDQSRDEVAAVRLAKGSKLMESGSESTRLQAATYVLDRVV